MDTIDSRSPLVVLEEDHRNLERLLDELRASTHAADREAAQLAWARVEAPLLKHLDVEERFLFPAIAAAHPKEVADLQREHDRLRREVGALGLAFEIHTARTEDVDALCKTLRAHAAREDALAYGSADRTVGADLACAIARWLHRAAVCLKELHAQ